MSSLEELYSLPQQTEEFSGEAEEVVKEVVKWVEENDFKVVGISAPTVVNSTDPSIVLYHNGRDIEDDTDKDKRVKDVEDAVRGALGLEVKNAPKSVSKGPKESTPPKPETPKRPENTGGTNSLADNHHNN